MEEGKSLRGSRIPCLVVSAGFLTFTILGAVMAFYVVSLTNDMKYMEAEIAELKHSKIDTEVCIIILITPQLADNYCW